MASEDRSWQKRMAPLMVGAVVSTAIFFAVVMLVRFSAIEQTLQDPPQSQISIPWTKAGLEPGNWRDQKDLASVQANFILERELIARRYRQASAMLSLRLWTRLMGFLTGMILAMVGAAFVLGKLTSPESEIAGGASGANVSIKSASPGIVMAALGTILIGIALVMPVTTDVHDAAIYFGRAEAPVEDPPSLEAMNPASDADSPPRQPATQEKRP
ncbi:hypothetical protein [Sphingomonas sp. MMS24-J13]|uniref:hypothetical protein n=1 Tax=Sphingomonas sp. MMS24-J13 TaxID=3238686 RepID=UPI00384A6768